MSSSSTSPIVLTSLSEREDITDALSRALIGIDENNMTIFDSAFAGQDVTFTMDDSVTEGLESIRTSLAHVFTLDTTHFITNVRIQMQEDSSNAHLTCNALAQHCPTGKGTDTESPKLTSGSRYMIDLVKDPEDDGLWKIKRWAMNIIWLRGDSSVMAPA